jgi:hypothetical protein
MLQKPGQPVPCEVTHSRRRLISMRTAPSDQSGDPLRWLGHLGAAHLVGSRGLEAEITS